MAGIRISIAADTRQFQSGIEDVTGELQGVADEADNVTAAGDRAGAALEDSMTRAQGATVPLAGGFQAVREDAEKTGEKFEEVGDRAETGSKLGRSAMMNLGYSSLSAGALLEGPGGIVESIGQFLAFGGSTLDLLGPIGAALGGLAVGGGLAMSVLGAAMGKTTDQAAEEKKAFSQLVTAIEGVDASQKTLYENTSTEAAALDKAKSSGKLYGESLSQIRHMASQAGVSVEELTKAEAGDGQAASRLLSEKKPLLESYQKQLEHLTTVAAEQDHETDAQRKAIAAAQDHVKKLKPLVDELEKRQKASKAATANIKQATAAEKAAEKQTDANTAAQKKAKAEAKALADGQKSYSQDLQQSIIAAGQDIDGFTKKGVFDLSSWEKNIIEKAKEADETTADINKAMTEGMSAAGEEYAEKLGPAFGTAYAAAEKKGKDAVAKLIRTMNDAGAASGKAYGKELESKLPSTVKGPKIEVSSNIAQVKRDIAGAAGQYYQTYVTVNGVTRQGRRVF